MFAQVDIIDRYISSSFVWKCCQYALEKYVRVIANIFYNNKQKLTADKVRKDAMKNLKSR